MCCGQVTRRLDDAGCQWLHNRHAAGETKRLLCAQFRIGADEFDRAVRRGGQLAESPQIMVQLNNAWLSPGRR